MTIRRFIYSASACLAFMSCPLFSEASFSTQTPHISAYAAKDLILSVPFAEQPSDNMHTSPTEEDECNIRMSVGVFDQSCADCIETLMHSLYDIEGFKKTAFHPDEGRILVTFRAGTTVSDAYIRSIMFNAGYVPHLVTRECDPSA